jgi:Ala-tRNA(Pro) deacylase
VIGKRDKAGLLAFFAENGLAHTTYDHSPIFTVDEGRHLKVDMPGSHSKNLFLEDKSGRLVLVSAHIHTNIRINGLHRRLGLQRMSFGSPERMFEALGVTPGSVTAFGLLNDNAGKVMFVLDEALMDQGPVNFHPLLNDATTAMEIHDFLRFLKLTGHDPVRLRFDAQGEVV